jgi:hypothetical protein
LPPLPDIPAGVLAAYHKPIDPSDSAVLARVRAGERFYRENFAEPIKNNHGSFLLLLPGYPHGIHVKDPELAVAVIQRLLKAIKKTL